MNEGIPESNARLKIPANTSAELTKRVIQMPDGRYMIFYTHAQDEKQTSK